MVKVVSILHSTLSALVGCCHEGSVDTSIVSTKAQTFCKKALLTEFEVDVAGGEAKTVRGGGRVTNLNIQETPVVITNGLKSETKFLLPATEELGNTKSCLLG